MLKNNTIKKIVSTLLITVMLFTSVGVAFGAAGSSDIKGHWAESQISKWTDKGLIKGYEDGSFKPDHSITRAEFMALVNRSFSFTEKAAISFSDISANNWAYSEIAIAVKAGYITGYANGTIGADKSISRQEAAAIVDRLLGLTNIANVETSFTDSSSIAQWAKGSVDAAVAKGILKGYGDNSFKPLKSITRAEAIVVLDRALASQADQAITYNKAGTYGPATGVETINKNVTINVAGVTLQNMVINGNLLLGEGIGEGDVFLENVKVTGKVTVQGGGENSIHFKNSVLVEVNIDKKTGTGTVRIVSEGTTTVALVVVNSPVTLQETNATGAGFGNVNLSASLPAESQVTLLGTFDTVNVKAQKIKVNAPENSKINELILDTIVNWLGKGTIVVAIINLAGSTFETQPLKIQTANTPSQTTGGNSGPTDITPPTVVSAGFTAADTLVITFSEAVNVTFMNFTNNIMIGNNTYYIHEISGSGTSSITLTHNLVPSGGSTGLIAISGVTDLAGNVMVSVPNQFITKYDNTPPTVITLGNGLEEVGILADSSVILKFNEELSEDVKRIIEAAITVNANHSLAYGWSWNNNAYELTISASVYTIFTNDIIVNVEDANGNTAVSLLLIDTSGDSKPTVLLAAFTTPTTLKVIFSEPVTATKTDFIPGAVAHINGAGTASSFEISGISGLGTSVITLTVAGTLDGAVVPLVGGDTAELSFGTEIKDMTENAIDHVVSIPITKFDNVRPKILSAKFTSATEITISFSEPVIAEQSSFRTCNTWNCLKNSSGNGSAAGPLMITGLLDSGTNSIRLTVTGNGNVPIGEGDEATIYLRGKQIIDLASNSYSENDSGVAGYGGGDYLFVNKLDQTPPTVTALGNSRETFTIAAGQSVALIFSEPVLSWNIEEAIANAVQIDADLTFDWNDESTVLTIKAGAVDVSFVDSVYIGIYDKNRVYSNNVLLIASKDNLKPVVTDSYFSSTSTIILEFSEAVTASIGDFTAGPIINGGLGSATGYRITAISGSGTDVIRLTVASIDSNTIVDGDSTTIMVGPGLKDLRQNSFNTSENPVNVMSFYMD
jgi:hypothetical protein